MKRYYLLGQNISKSLSPQLHNLLFKYKSFSKALYENYPEGKKIPTVEQILTNQQFQGFSITMPYKKHYIGNQKIKLNKQAIQIQVINTLVKQQGNFINAYNTDIFGIEKALQNKINDKKDNLFIIIGAGATSTTFCHYLTSKQVSIILLNRSQQSMKLIQNKYKTQKSKFQLIQFNKMSDKLQQDIKLKLKNVTGIINTLPKDIILENKEILIKLTQQISKKYQKQIVYMDVSYLKQAININENILLSSFIDKKFNIIKGSGLQMLMWQAIKQNRLFCKQDQQKYSQEQYQKQANLLRQLCKQIL